MLSSHRQTRHGHHTGQVITRTANAARLLANIAERHGMPSSTINPSPRVPDRQAGLGGLYSRQTRVRYSQITRSISRRQGSRTPSRLGTRIPGFSDAEHAFSPFWHWSKCLGEGCFSAAASQVWTSTYREIRCPFPPPRCQSGRGWSSNIHMPLWSRGPGPNSKGVLIISIRVLEVVSGVVDRNLFHL